MTQAEAALAATRTWDDPLFVNFTRVVGAWVALLGSIPLGVAIWLLLGG